MKEYKVNDRDEAKKITFRQLYGGVEPKYRHIKFFNFQPSPVSFHIIIL